MSVICHINNYLIIACYQCSQEVTAWSAARHHGVHNAAHCVCGWHKIFQGIHSLRLGSFPNKFLGRTAIQEVHNVYRTALPSNPLSPLTSHPPSSTFLPTNDASHTFSRLFLKRFFPPLLLVNSIPHFSRPPLHLSSVLLSLSTRQTYINDIAKHHHHNG